MDCHEIGGGDNLLQGGQPDAEGVCDLFREEGVVSDHGHVERLHAFGDLASDAAHADDSQDLPVELDPGVLGPLPLAPVHGLVGEGDVPRQCQEHRAGVLCRGEDVRGRGVHDEDPLVGGAGDVDVVHPYPGASDDLQVLPGLDHLGGDLRPGPDDQAVVVPDDRAELVLGEAGLHVHREPGFLQYIDSLVGEGV